MTIRDGVNQKDMLRLQPTQLVTALSILKTVRLRLWPKKNCSALASPNSSAPALVPAKTARLRRWYQQKNSSALALASQNSSAPALVPANTARLRRWYQPKQLCSGSGQTKQLGSGSGTSQNMQLCSGSALFEKYWRIRCMWLMMLLQALCDVKLNRGKCSKF